MRSINFILCVCVCVCAGPLQYHFENVPGEMSFELSYDHIRLAMVNLGFDFVVRSMQRERRDKESQ